ncbi:MAG: hypothetical protein ACI4PU_07740 [Intestinibacter sp.]
MFYMMLLDSIANGVLTANFFVNILDLKYKKYICFFIFFIMCNFIYLLDSSVIMNFNLSNMQGMLLKFVIFTVSFICSFYILSICTFKKSILLYIYYFAMGCSVELLATLLINHNVFEIKLFIDDMCRAIFAVVGNVILCVVSMFYLLVYFKRKNKIKNNYMFLVLILPIVQVFILNRYSTFLENNVTIEILLSGTVFFTLQIFINIIILNLVMKSILLYDLEQKVFLADIENEKNKYVRDLYKSQKFYFNKLINDFKFPLNNILNASYFIKKNKFKSRGIFNIGLQNIIDEAKYLNNMIVDLLDKQKNIF